MVTNSRITLRSPMRTYETLAFELLVLRGAADHRERMDLALLADGRVTVDDDVREQFRVAADLDVFADQAIGADLDTAADARGRMDDGGRMDVQRVNVDPLAMAHVPAPLLMKDRSVEAEEPRIRYDRKRELAGADRLLIHVCFRP